MDSQAQGPNADDRFVQYYAEQSESQSTRQRFEGTRRVTLQVRRELGLSLQGLDVADIGCGAGSQSLLWAQDGHRVHGVDISQPLIDLARQRASAAGAEAQFQVGSAGKLPLPDASLDVVLVSELLEHLNEWEPCVNEALRVLRPGGVVYLSTTNKLCPRQQEFALPGYSWYPAPLKRWCERRSVTTHRHWVQFVSYPAVHWFSFYQLRDYLARRGFRSKDRFDVMQTEGAMVKQAAVRLIKAVPLARFAAHVCTPYTVLVGHRPVD